MANWYYLAAQLPSFTVNAASPLPLSESAFLELCVRFVDVKTLAVLSALSLEPPRTVTRTGCAPVDAWNEMENSLRLALALVRAQKLQKDFSAPAVSIRPEGVQAARTAYGMDSPLSAELYLNEFRAGVLDRLATPSVFSTGTLIVYALRLKLASRIRKFNEEAGKASYRMIYDRILGETT